MTIGTLATADIVGEARRWSELAGTPCPAVVREVTDLRPWSHADLRPAARAYAARPGGMVVASGGTTGAPKLSYIAADMGIPRMRASWDPLRPDDLLLNLFTMGRLWGAHPFYSALAAHSSCAVAPMGAVLPDEVPDWVDTLVGLGVTALAGAPNVLSRFARAVSATGARLPVRTVIWSGEPMTAARAAAVRAAFPTAGLWANYGSIETFPIGVNGPTCPPGTMHLLPGQLLEPDRDGALLTRVGDGWPAPAVRLRLGDRVRPASCSCGSRDAFEVLGRADDRFKLYGNMLSVSDILHHASTVDGVFEAQLVLYRDPHAPDAVNGICLRYNGTTVEPAQVHKELVTAVRQLAAVSRHAPEAVAVEQVTEMESNTRTNKVVPVLWRDAANEGDK
jgi:phenylacetate-CoA ligase